MKFTALILAGALAALLTAPAEPEAAQRSSVGEIKLLQEILRQCGFDPGGADGVWNLKTARAAADYIRAHGHQPMGGGELTLVWQSQDLFVAEGGPCPETRPPPRPRRRMP